jgi:hypothetical protein
MRHGFLQLIRACWQQPKTVESVLRPPAGNIIVSNQAATIPIARSPCLVPIRPYH